MASSRAIKAAWSAAAHLIRAFFATYSVGALSGGIGHRVSKEKKSLKKNLLKKKPLQKRGKKTNVVADRSKKRAQWVSTKSVKLRKKRVKNT